MQMADAGILGTEEKEEGMMSASSNGFSVGAQGGTGGDRVIMSSGVEVR